MSEGALPVPRLGFWAFIALMLALTALWFVLRLSREGPPAARVVAPQLPGSASSPVAVAEPGVSVRAGGGLSHELAAALHDDFPPAPP